MPENPRRQNHDQLGPAGIRRAARTNSFENSAHAPIYDSVEEFNEKTLAFLQRCARGAAV